MFKIIAVTNRRLCGSESGAFPARLEALAAAGIDALILREKDLPPAEYETLARQAAAVCARHNVPFIPHSFIDAARALGCGTLHLSWELFRRGAFEDSAGPAPALGVSVHSVEEARCAGDCGAAWLIAGHVFPTDCKKGLEARGLDFLASVCGAVHIPVYGIGGVTEENIALLPRTGAAGACFMSAFMGRMEHSGPAALIARLRAAVRAGPLAAPPTGRT